jgi:hypothetical protein
MAQPSPSLTSSYPVAILIEPLTDERVEFARDAAQVARVGDPADRTDVQRSCAPVV